MCELCKTQEQSVNYVEKAEKEMYESRVIYLNEGISSMTVDYLVPLIQKFNKDDKDIPVKDRQPIQLHINSYGGSAYDGWNIISYMTSSLTPIHTYLYGYAMSMGLALFVAGDKRHMSKYSTLMYHELSSRLEGTREEMKRAQFEYDRLQDIYDSFLIDRTKLTLDTLTEHQSKVSDWYIDLETALELGLATDEIATK